MPAKPKPETVDLDHILPIALQPKQEQLCKIVEDVGLKCPTIIGFGGSRGGSKSASIRRIMLKRRLELPGTDGVILRRVLQDLRDNHINPMWKDFPQLQQLFHVQTTEIHLPNGSRILFRYAETPSDVDRKFWGPEYYDIFVDQAEQFTSGELETIGMAARSTGVPPGSCKVGLFFNPGGPGMEYFRRVFWKKNFKPEEDADNFFFLQAYGWDNYEWFRGSVDIEYDEFYQLSSEDRFQLFITKTSYGKKLNALPKSKRDGHLLGSFEVFAGQYFGDAWDDALCVVKNAVKCLTR